MKTRQFKLKPPNNTNHDYYYYDQSNNNKLKANNNTNMQPSNCIREACFSTCCSNPNPPSSAAAGASPRRDFISAIAATLNTTFTNHESLPSSAALLSALRDAVPNYSSSALADAIRSLEYRSLSRRVCLDYVGHGLFSAAAAAGTAADGASTSAPAPAEEPFFDFSYSSANLTSHLLYGGEERPFHAAARRRIMKYMNLSDDDYSIIFTANQSSAFKLLGHSYPFGPNQNLATVYDYDNEAVQLMVDAARRGGGRHHSAVFSWPSLKVNSKKLRKVLASKNRGLFAFPLQSRMSGARYSYQWMNLARENGWHVLLDASALAAKEMETLGLSLFHPDFIICSFFKIFGDNPSGFCCLFVKKSIISVLHQSATNMGIINLVPARNPSLAAVFDEEDETTPTPSSTGECGEESEIVEEVGDDRVIEFRGLEHADTLGLILISSRLRYLVNWVVNALMSLRHPHNSLALVTLYGPRIRLDRGPAVAFNVCDWKGERVEPFLVQKLADRNNISLSIGFLKNICFSEEDKEGSSSRKKKRDYGVGVVSASLGMLTNFEDVYRFWAFVARFLDADFVEKERWRYTALNQTTVEV